MKRLNQSEVYELKSALGDPECECEWDEALVQELVEAGYLLLWEDEEWIYIKTTPRGELALRCHEALVRCAP